MKGHQVFKLAGAHLVDDGTRFRLWAPSAQSVALKLNDQETVPMNRVGEWFEVVADAPVGTRYRFVVTSSSGEEKEKFDPFGRHFPDPARLDAVVVASSPPSEWTDRARLNSKPMSIYEVHIGSWRRRPDGDFLSYEEIAKPLIDYVQEMGFTHVEFLPVAEHPFYASWGYQPLGFFAPTSRYGTVAQFKSLVDALHDANIGVLLDFVPSHFPVDDWGLYQFDGSALFEHPDPRRGFHPDWNSAIFNYDDPRVRAFLVSAACFWFEQFGIDGVRVDAVASMLYLDYSRQPGEWLPNVDGGVANYGAMTFLTELNDTIHREFPGGITVAEESTAWPNVTHEHGLRFDYKWDMGWMNDTLVYFAKDPIYRKHHHRDVTFRAIYAGSESFVVALSHDEVVHAKGSIFGKMAGESSEEKLRHAQLLMAWMFAAPGAKLLFMGMEFAQRSEWNHDAELEWELTTESGHRAVQETVQKLNALYREESALQRQHSDETFSWIRVDDADESVVIFSRTDTDAEIVCVFNFTSVHRNDFRIGVPSAGSWEILYDSSGRTGEFESTPTPADRAECSVQLTLEGLSAVFLKRV